MTVSKDEANDLFHALIRLQKLMLAAKSSAPRVNAALDAGAYPTLFTIARLGPVGISDIASLVHSDVSTVSRQVSSLVSHGFLAKQSDPSDGRASLVSLTDAGHDVLGHVQHVRGTWFQGLLDDWESDEAHEFTTHLPPPVEALDRNLRDRGDAPPAAYTASPAAAGRGTATPARPVTKEN